MGVKRNYFKGKSEYTVFYQSLRGVDLSSRHSSDRTRLSYMENMYRDYDGDDPDAIVSIPGFRSLCKLDGKINALYEKKNADGSSSVIAHAADSLYLLTFDSQGTKSTKIADIKDTKSTAVSFGCDLFIFDGETVIKVGDGGVVRKIGDDELLPYVPTTFKEGEPYEQRNLLTDVCKEKYTIASTTYVSYGTPELIYKITDADALTCAVTGIYPTFAGDEINIPSFVKIGKLSYRVEQISDGAFKNVHTLSAVNIHEGLLRVGNDAFFNCTGLVYVKFPETMIELGDRAMKGCVRMQGVYLGKNVNQIGSEVFDECESLWSIDFGGNEEDFASIKNKEAVTCDINYNHVNRFINISIPINTPAKKVVSITLNGKEFTFFAEMKNKEKEVRAVILRIEDSADADGKEVVITLEAFPDKSVMLTEEADLVSSNTCTCTGAEAVLGCTIAEAFDGRIFLSGNPKLPNTVIYSARDETGNNNPLYYGTYNYFNDGIAAYPVIDLLCTSDSLAVFKSDDDGCGSIFYHSPKMTDNPIMPKIYPVSYIHSGICASGEAISFYDDPVFVSRKGICALDKKTINLDRSICCRSHNINAQLLMLDPAKIRLARWCGYLVVCAEGKIFLGDSRALFKHDGADIEYEWFCLNGIGSYDGASTVYRYCSTETPGFSQHENPDGIAKGVVYSYGQEDGELVYYTEDNGKRYRVFPTDEKTGGIFSPATALLSVEEERLFFGTENGCVMIFNNDMRGISPNSEENDTMHPRRLHPEYYDFDKHAPRYAIKTAYDNCSVPHLEKNTVKGSLTLKCGILGGAKLHCEIGTDKGDFCTVATIPNSELDFSYFDFATLSFCATDNATLPIEEKEKGWVEKQIAIYSDEYKAPIRIYGITYRFTVKGKIKNNR